MTFEENIEALKVGIVYSNDEIEEHIARIKAASGDVQIKRVCGYGRVSTKYEEQESSLRTQHEVFRRYCDSHECDGYVLVEEVYEQKSGTLKEKRIKFMSMVEDALHGKYDVLLFKDSKRFSRNAEDFLGLIEQLKRAGVSVVFINEGLNSSLERDRTMLSMLGMMAENYSNSLHNNLTTALRIRMESELGRLPGDVFGYKRHKEDTSKADIVPEQAALLVELFTRYASGEGISSIASDWIKRDIRTYRGGKMSLFALRRYIRNPLYKGVLIMGKYTKSDVRAKRIKNSEDSLIVRDRPDLIIIDPELWDVCNKRMDMNKQKMDEVTDGKIGYRTDILRDKLFSGVIKCGECGRNYNRRISHHRGCNRYTYVMCGFKKYNKNNMANGIVCHNELVFKLDLLVDVVSGLMSDMIKNQEGIREVVRDKIASIIKEKQSNLNNYKLVEKYEETLHKYNRYVVLYKDGMITKQEYIDVRNELKDLEQQINSIDNKTISSEIVSVLVDKFFDNLKESIKEQLVDEGGVDVKAFNKLFKNITVYSDHVDIVFNIFSYQSIGRVSVSEVLSPEYVHYKLYAPLVDNKVCSYQALVRKMRRKKKTNIISERNIQVVEINEQDIDGSKANQVVNGIKEIKLSVFIE